MLYNPKWEQKTKADPFTLEGLIAWLEHQPVSKKYNYMNCQGRCLYGQYMKSVGVCWDEAAPTGHSPDPHRAFREKVYLIACRSAGPSIFGAALERARALL